MATDYDAMAAAIADEAGDSALTSQIQECILRARRKYDRKRFYFNEKTNTFATVASQEYYGSSDLADIPNLISIDDMKILIDSSATYPLTPLDFGIMDGIQTGQVFADPNNYAYFGQRIRLYPIPSAVRTITMAYHYRAPDPTFGGTVSDIWTQNAYDLIKAAAARFLHRHYTKEDDEVTRAGQAEAEALSDIAAEGRRRISNGVLRTDIPMRRERLWITRGW